MNTLLSYAVYWLLLRVLPYQAAYAASYVIGLLTGYVFNTRFVFRVSWSLRDLLPYPSIYLATYALGAAVMWLAVRIGVAEALAPIVATLVTVPSSFVLLRRVLRRPS